MFRRIWSLAIGITTCLAGSVAMAQGAPPAAPAGRTLGDAGVFALSVDRVYGFSMLKDKETITVGNQEATRTTTYTGFSVIGHGVGLPPSPYSTPRIALDYFVIDGLSLGGSITYMSTSSNVKNEAAGTSVSRDGPTFSAFAVAPRVGYAVMFNDFIGIWPRGGITYYNIKEESQNTDPVSGITTTDTNKLNGFAVSAEVPIVLSPAPHVALTFAPTIDIPLSGTTEATTETPAGTTSQSHDETLFEFGFQGGLLAWF